MADNNSLILKEDSTPSTTIRQPFLLTPEQEKGLQFSENNPFARPVRDQGREPLAAAIQNYFLSLCTADRSADGIPTGGVIPAGIVARELQEAVKSVAWSQGDVPMTGINLAEALEQVKAHVGEIRQEKGESKLFGGKAWFAESYAPCYSAVAFSVKHGRKIPALAIRRKTSVGEMMPMVADAVEALRKARLFDREPAAAPAPAPTSDNISDAEIVPSSES